MADDPAKRTIRVRVRSMPFMDDPQGAEAYYTALGRVLVLWGRFESQLDSLVLILSNFKPCRPFVPRELPISMKRRAELLRDLLKKVPELAPLRDPLLALLPQAMDSAQDRHVITHGHWAGFVKADVLTSRFVMKKHKAEKLIIQDYRVSLDNLNKMISTFDRLLVSLLPITWNASVMSNSSGPRKSQAPAASRTGRRSPARRKPNP